jgi:thiamine biosynthesis lipoprotein
MQKPSSIGRRDFLKILACCGTAGLAIRAGVDSLTGFEKVTETRLLMGTVVNLTVIADNITQGRTAIQTCLNRMEHLETILSRFQIDSQLSILNRKGWLADADPALLDVLELAQQVSVWSQGAFDITVKPLVDLYIHSFESQKSLPEQREIEHICRLVDYRQVEIEGSAVRLEKAGAGVTLDGIAKGYIIDQGVAALKSLGCKDVFVEAGGDLFASGEKTPGHAWEVGILSPRPRPERILSRCPLTNGALATSGDYQQSFSTDYAHHHIVDPRSGYSSPLLSSVTVQATTTALADALATAVMVLGPQAGMGLIEQVPGCEALLVTKNMEIVHSAGFQTQPLL